VLLNILEKLKGFKFIPINITIMNFIIIDASYFIFYRYHALKTWIKHSDNEIDEDKLYENEIFMEKFLKTFQNKIKETEKKLKIPKKEKIIKLAGIDCPRNEIWRKSLFPDYKESRGDCDNNIKHIFKYTYNNNLFTKSGINKLLYHEHLEADDVIAITIKYLKHKYDNSKFWVITSDMDYLQLFEKDKVMLYDLKYNLLTEKKKSTADPKKDLFYKIVMGDKSDNIPAIFKKCGPKTTEKLYNDNELFESKLKEDDKVEAQYQLNKTLIDFNCIPKNYVEDFAINNLYNYEI